MAQVCRDARLTYALTWCIADDAGLFRAEPRQLVGALYPHDRTVTEDQLEAWLVDLVALGVLRWRFTREGARVGELVNFSKRQKIDRPSKSFLNSELLPLANGSRGGGEGVPSDSREVGETLAVGVLSLEPRVLSPEPRVVGGDDDDLASISRYTELRDRLPEPARPALVGYVRAARDPMVLVQVILAEGPDTGTNGSAGKTWPVIGQALIDMRAAGEAFRPVVFRAFVTRAVRDAIAGALPGGAGAQKDYQRAADLARGTP